MNQLTMRPIRVGITMGDPAGIGPEIITKALTDHSHYEGMIPVIYGDPLVFKETLARTKTSLQLRVIKDPLSAQGLHGTLEIVPTTQVNSTPELGQVNPKAGEMAVQAIGAAIHAALRGEIDAINTAPINKEAVRTAGYHYPGHTEMLAELFSASHVITMFVVGNLRVFFLTRHHPLKDAIELLTVDRVYEGIRQSIQYLVELGFAHPILAVAALNPHAGENGLIGSEEQEILIPAIKKAQHDGLSVEGPIPADAVFYQARMGRYHGVLSLYHDQGHIATKTLDFNGTVSVTLGLPVIRTSVDHGTAFDIAGQGIADAHGQSEALRVAKELTLLKLSRI
ncbi:4-hydroxythreonine-4-phosphate dehydrogenase PdxA [Sulfobacillus thermosulfidooxidans]|uniref:4-hydroxythreonine-4-phosphate dehydrogenase PdxA n=1 Tax=Sulfobacillus thermosulfidooxidans TaxID=28034 RepID=UPI0006B43124|nr:4-hydroxythreonine-4-phosphate dehydrogenase PdxA [Sulfobacillus thermosulfidooxidans]